MKKKPFILLCILLFAALSLSFFAPFYQVLEDHSGVIYGRLGFFWECFASQGGNLQYASWGFLVAFLALFVTGEVFLLRSYHVDKEKDDIEDKFFVFGVFFIALGFALFSMLCLAITSLIPLVVAILYAVLAVVSVVIHHKFLTSY